MKAVKNDLPETLETLKIELFFDLHIGSKKCNYDAIKKRIQQVKDNPDTYCIIGGDLCNNSTKTSVGDVYEEEMSPMAQVQKCIELFRPISDKILGICAGNHERRSYKTDGIDLMYLFAAELNIADKYDYTSCLLFIRFGKTTQKVNRGRKNCYSLYMTHGDGNGGRTIGGKANGLQRRGEIVDADIIVTGHTHAPLSFRDCFYRIDYPNSRVNKKEQLFVNASATLDYESYAELYGMKPSSIESPVIILDGKQKNMKAVL